MVKRKKYAMNFKCPNCKMGRIVEIETTTNAISRICYVEKDDFNRWISGELMIQEAFPTLAPDLREKMMSGLCDKCFKSLGE